ncbi:MAG: protein translocase subunit SecD [bacterium]
MSMYRGFLWKGIVVVLSMVLAVFMLYPPTQTINLGLDLKGGIYLAYRIDTTKLPPDLKEDEAVSRALRIIRDRVDHLGVTNPKIQRTASGQISVALPGIKNPGRAKKVIGKTAQLKFHLVKEDMRKEYNHGLTSNVIKMKCGPSMGTRQCPKGNLIVTREPSLTGGAIEDANVRFGRSGRPGVGLTFNDEGGQQFGDLTAEHVDERIAIVLDNAVISAPTVNQAIYGGQARISGRFTDREAADLALMIRAGALPAPLEQIQERGVGPSLGEDSIRNGIYASVAALVLVVLFMGGYYHYAGLVADITLGLCLLFLVAGLAGIGATLTLPGIAGIVLTVGIAVDANVIIYERVKDEREADKSVRNALETGFDRSIPAIVDAQVTTVITALALYFFGVGPVKGYAITLILGILASLYSAIFVGRYLFSLSTIRSGVKRLHLGWKLPFGHWFKNTLRWAPWALMVSGIVISIGIGGMLYRGGLLYGIDFTGGLRMVYRFREPVDSARINVIRNSLGDVTESYRVKTVSLRNESKRRGVMITARTDRIVDRITGLLLNIPENDWKQRLSELLTDRNLSWIDEELIRQNYRWGNGPSTAVNLSEASSESIRHRAQTLVNENIVRQIARRFREGFKRRSNSPGQNRSFELVKREMISPAIGSELIYYSALALLLSFLGILVYLYFRFQFEYAIGAIIAILHDVFVVVGLLTVLGVDVDIPVVAALLTVIGYSINDTIVNFDRVRENRRRMGSSSNWFTVINRSVYEVLNRTLITSLTTFIAVLVLYLYGGVVLRDFSLALLLGVIFGTFSSVMIANYLLYQMKNREIFS